MTMNRHEPFEELISASLHGDLTADERRRLDTHLDACDQCRGTLAAFAEERRMIAGLRHVAPPRDLGARVRAGIEHASVPWWRKPATIFTAVGGTLAAVTGALLALVVLNGTPTGPEVADATPTPAASTATPAATRPALTPMPVTTLPPLESPAPGETPAPPTTDPSATPNPIAQSSPEPDLLLAVQPATPTEDQSLALVAGSTGETVLEPDPPTELPDPTVAAGEPIAAELSSDGEWLAYLSRNGFSGTSQVLVTRADEPIVSPEASAEPAPTPLAAVGETFALRTSVGTSPFLERLAWSPDSRYLAYTVADPEANGTDVWVFDTATNEEWQLTDVHDAFAASWVDVPDADAPALWVSRAEGTVASYLTEVVTADGDRAEAIDPATAPIDSAENVFQPLLSPNGALAIYWKGRMASVDGEWVFSEGGAPQLSEHRPFDEALASPFPEERPLFSGLTITREAFTSAAIAWGVDGNSYVVWNTAWTGGNQGSQGTYPDASRIYFGHATDARGITEAHAIDAGDVPADWSVVDVKVSPTGRHLVVMVAAPRSGQEAPTANLLLIERRPDLPDVVDPITEGEGVWYGPAVFDAYVEIPGDESGEEPAATPSESGSP